MVRKLAAAVLLSFAALAPAEEAPMFSVSLDQLGAVEVVSHELRFPDAYIGPLHMAVELRLASGHVGTFRFEIPAEALEREPGYISHSHWFVAAGRRWYLGEQALWEGDPKLHVEPKVFLPQARLSPDGRALRFFVDSDKFRVVGRESRRRGAFAALHGAS